MVRRTWADGEQFAGWKVIVGKSYPRLATVQPLQDSFGYKTSGVAPYRKITTRNSALKTSLQLLLLKVNKNFSLQPGGGIFCLTATGYSD
jgi:hypothetical protein